jgi:hypothetical protein
MGLLANHIKMAYCDFIADRINKLIDREIGDNETLIDSVGNVNMDLHPTEGYLVSTKKSMTVYDVNGKAYIVTVEEAPFLDKS